ncbi:hypothetical protein HETIRDRAFT_427322 [Heterobasidion irregulare TC 32-1]|uniref:Uncharacterized protein n=1 Tax=Heterobasidion irregulare (strain TC 32-1) TaxID=747525 RepID=W4K8W0_HETIT|nr:uncharacterized protein HETIRDRAFT_427322 [Heterobasidion irregulare TC 32-1]ETW82223.1 hypothetical protein HETIRDRAFT_427322 [Heterobasidion irregulare TC 32-1]
MTLPSLALCVLLVFVLETAAIAHALTRRPVAPRDEAPQGGITESTAVDMIVAVGTTSNIESYCRHSTRSPSFNPVLSVVVIATFMWLDWVCRTIRRTVSLERRLRLEIRNLLTLFCGVAANGPSTPGGVGRPANRNSDAAGIMRGDPYPNSTLYIIVFIKAALTAVGALTQQEVFESEIREGLRRHMKSQRLYIPWDKRVGYGPPTSPRKIIAMHQTREMKSSRRTIFAALGIHFLERVQG